MRIPEPYFAAHGEEPIEYIMVLEDLRAAGCTFTDRLEPHADDHAGNLVESLARLHAQFWNDPRFDDELSWVPLAMRGPYGAKLIDSAREQFRDEFPPVFDEPCRLYSENHEAITEWWDEGERSSSTATPMPATSSPTAPGSASTTGPSSAAHRASATLRSTSATRARRTCGGTARRSGCAPTTERS